MEQFQFPQDLHIHTTFSAGDTAVAVEQTVDLVAGLGHAKVLGISDHLDWVGGAAFDKYRQTVRGLGLHLGLEVDGASWVEEALELPVDYFVYHCYDNPVDYQGAERLLSGGKPVIAAHPLFLGTNPDHLPPDCLVEINNRYVWRSDWRTRFLPFLPRFKFVISSDAHQPHWLSQHLARHVAREIGVTETLLF